MIRIGLVLFLVAAIAFGCGKKGDTSESDSSNALVDTLMASKIRNFAEGPPAVGDITRWTEAGTEELVSEAKEVCADMARLGVPTVMQNAYMMNGGGARGTKVFEVMAENKCPGFLPNVKAWYSTVPKYFRYENSDFPAFHDAQ